MDVNAEYFVHLYIYVCKSQRNFYADMQTAVYADCAFIINSISFVDTADYFTLIDCSGVFFQAT